MTYEKKKVRDITRERKDILMRDITLPKGLKQMITFYQNFQTLKKKKKNMILYLIISFDYNNI